MDAPPKTLVFCSAGNRIHTLSWLAGLPQQAQMQAALVYYGEQPIDAPAEATHFLHNKDFKFPNFLQLVREVPQVLDFDLYLFIDDDIVVSAETLARWRDIITRQQLDISQPALRPESKADWPHVLVQPGLTIDPGQFVEIQCFALSRRALQLALPYFFMVKTGAGLDVALYRLAIDRQLRNAVVHEVQVLHPHRPEAQTVRSQFSNFAAFNTQMSRMMDFCLPGHASFDDLAHASRVLGNTAPSALRWVASVNYVMRRIRRVIGRVFGRVMGRRPG